MIIFICISGWICTVRGCWSEKPTWGDGWLPICQASCWCFLCSNCSSLAASILFYLILTKVSIYVPLALGHLTSFSFIAIFVMFIILTGIATPGLHRQEFTSLVRWCMRKHPLDESTRVSAQHGWRYFSISNCYFISIDEMLEHSSLLLAPLYVTWSFCFVCWLKFCLLSECCPIGGKSRLLFSSGFCSDL